MTRKGHEYVVLALATAFGATPAAQGQKMYWSDFGGIVRANLDGSDREVVVSIFSSVFGLALDPVRRKIYWAEPFTNSIHRANLDGTDEEDLVTPGLDEPWGIAVEFRRPRCIGPTSVTARFSEQNWTEAK